MPRVKLTQRFVDDLLGAEPPEGDTFYWSEREAGFGVKHKAGSGRVSWCIQWRDRRTGKSHRLALGDAAKVKLDTARRAAETRHREIAAGKNPIHERRDYREAMTFRQFVEKIYLASDKWRQKAPSTRVSDANRIGIYLLPALGGRKLLEITSDDVKRLFRDLCNPEAAAALARKGGATKNTVRGGEGGARRTMRLLKAILAFAAEEKQIPENPAAGLKIGSDGERAWAPDDDAYARFWAALETLRAMADTTTMVRALDALALIALTGARRAEIQRLRWRHVDLDGRRIVLGKAEHKTGKRTGKSRVIALPDDAVAVLSGYERGDPGGFVFAGLKLNAPVALQRPWERLAEAAGLPAGMTPHSLRHGYGTLLATAGMAAPQIAMALGHAQWRTSERYVHAVDRARAELAQKGAELVRPKKLRSVG